MFQLQLAEVVDDLGIGLALGLISQSSKICIGGQVADLRLLRQQVEQAARQPGERFEAL